MTRFRRWRLRRRASRAYWDVLHAPDEAAQDLASRRFDQAVAQLGGN